MGHPAKALLYLKSKNNNNNGKNNDRDLSTASRDETARLRSR
jgi:hypothetical protein